MRNKAPAAGQLEAEVHAHAQQLLKLSRDLDIGYAVMIVSPSGQLIVASNLTMVQKRDAVKAWLAAPIHSSFHGPGGDG